MNLFNTKYVKETEYAKEIKRLREQLESRDKTIESLSATISDLTKKLCYPVLNATEPEVKKGRKKKEAGEKKSQYKLSPDRALSIETKWRRISKLRSKGLSWAEVANKVNGSLYATIAFYKYHKHKFEEK